MSEPTIQLCTKCGTELAAFATEGFCSACLLEQGLFSESPAAPLLSKFGDYELLEEIARGGMGVVYKARQVGLNRLVAVKMILSGQFASAAEMERFRAEARAVAALQHPGIVAIHEVGERDGQLFFSMDFINGRNLAQLIRDGPWPAARTAQCLLEISEAIHYAHQQGVLHRDLKPSNVLITADGKPCITDFGLAKRLPNSKLEKPDSELTVSGQILGSPNFMPPEQAAGKIRELTPASDVYSLGALLYHLLTGRPPFVADNIPATLRLVAETEPVAPRLLAPTVPRDLETICLKCLAKEPRRRYGTARELAEELGRFLRDEPIRARPVSQGERFWRWCRRHPAVAGLAATVVVLLVAATAVSTTFGVRASRDRAGALRSEGVAKAARTVAEQREHAESQAKAAALFQQKRAEDALTEMQLQRAEEFFAADDSSRALAHLATVLRSDGSNRVAAERLLSALTLRSFSLPLLDPIQHQHYVWSAEFSPDGRRVVTASFDKTARVWDALTGRPLSEPMRHQASVDCAQFSPDGLRILTASRDRTARVWDALTGTPLTEPLRHQAWVRSAQFSPDGLRVVTASEDRTARVWDALTGKPLTGPIKHVGPVIFAQFSPDGLSVVTASDDKTARVWEASSGQPITPVLQHGYDVYSAQFSPDGRFVVTTSGDRDARVWDAQTGKPLTEPLRHELGASFATVSPDGLRVLTASSDGTARLWDAQTGKLMPKSFRHEAGIHSARFSPDGRRVVTASWDNTARVWDALTGKPLTEPLRHEGDVRSAHFSADGLRVVTASFDKTARVWEALPRKTLNEALRHNGMVRSAEFSADGLRVLTVSQGKLAHLWDARTGKPPIAFQHEDDVRSAQFSPDGSRIVTACDDNTARLWDAQTGIPLAEPLRHESYLLFAHFSPDGHHVVTGSDDRTARVWDAQTGKPLTPPLRHQGPVHVAQFSPDGRRVLTASSDTTVRVWDAQTGTPLTDPLRHGTMVSSAQFSPDGLRILTASPDNGALVWDAQTGTRLAKTARDEFSSVGSAQFSPDGRRLVTAGDKAARVWDAFTGRPLTGPLRHEGAVAAAQFSPDGLRVVTAAHDNTARVWDALTGRPLTEPLRHDAWLRSAQFSPDGLRVVTASDDSTARVWEMTFGPVPVPDWLPQLAEGVAGKKLVRAGFFEAMAPGELLQLREQLLNNPATNFHTRWAKWFFADQASRTMTPFSSLTGPQFDSLRLGSQSTTVTNRARPAGPARVETLSQMEDELKGARARLAPTHPDLLAAMLRLATAYRTTNRLADAEYLIEEMLAAERKTLPPLSRQIAKTLEFLGELQLGQGKYTNAESVLRECVGIMEKNQPGLTPTFQVQGLLGAALLGQQKFVEAEGLLVPAYAGLKKREFERPSPLRAQLLQSTAGRLVQLYTAWSKPDKAEEWRKKSLK